jgi:hypothetical protein
MADFGNPVQMPDVNPSRGIQTLSGLLSLKQQQQGLQQGQQALDTGAAQLQQEQQKAAELQQARAVLQRIPTGDYRDKNGDLDAQRLSTDLAAIGPFAGAAAGQVISIGNDLVTNQKALQNLTEESRGQIGGVLNSLATNPNTTRRDVTDAVTDWIADHAGDKNAVRVGKGAIQLVTALQDGPQLRSFLSNIAGQFAKSQQSTPTSIDTGAVVQPGQVLNATGEFSPSGKPVTKGIAPGWRLHTDERTGNSYLINEQTQEVQDLGKGKSGRTSSLPAPYYPGQMEDTRRFQDEVNATRAAGDQAPIAANINSQILRLSKNASTGPGSEVWQHAIGALGAPFGLSPSASYQEIGKFLEKNAIANMQSMGGPPSDARLSAASAANGSTTFSPAALQAVTKFNDATTTGLAQYRQGIDKAVGMGPQTDYTKLPKFKSDWTKNFDVNVFRVENAIRDGDQEELAKITKEVGAEGLKKLAEKRAKLQKLSADGGL